MKKTQDQVFLSPHIPSFLSFISTKTYTEGSKKTEEEKAKIRSLLTKASFIPFKTEEEEANESTAEKGEDSRKEPPSFDIFPFKKRVQGQPAGFAIGASFCGEEGQQQEEKSGIQIEDLFSESDEKGKKRVLEEEEGVHQSLEEVQAGGAGGALSLPGSSSSAAASASASASASFLRVKKRVKFA